MAQNLAKGMGQVEAIVAAGYSVGTANRDAYRIVRHPEVQSRLTEAVARVLAQEQKQFDDIVRPYVKALDANVVVKMPQLGDAVETKVVDHATRMAAAEHLTNLYRAKQADESDGNEGGNGPSIVYQVNFIEAGAKPNGAAAPVIEHAPPVVVPNGSATVPQVKFVNGKR